MDAFFGDANGDGKIGQSDIFSSIVVSDGGKTITLSGGLIPAGGHFTDIAHSSTTDDLPFFAGVDTSFDGVLAVCARTGNRSATPHRTRIVLGDTEKAPPPDLTRVC